MRYLNSKDATILERCYCEQVSWKSLRTYRIRDALLRYPPFDELEKRLQHFAYSHPTVQGQVPRRLGTLLRDYNESLVCQTYLGKVASSCRHVQTSQVQLTSAHHGTTTTTQLVLIMSQYNNEPQFAAHDAGWDAFDPELAPFLPTMDQSGGWTPPARAGTRQSTGGIAVLPPTAEFVSLHAKVTFPG